MDLIIYIIIGIIGYVITLWLIFKYSKWANKNFTDKRMKVNKNIKLTTLKYGPSKTKNIDILRQIYLLTLSLNEDGRRTNNCIILDYPNNYPRIFNIYAPMLISLIDSLTQIILLNIKNSTVIIKFLLINYHETHIKFNISVWSDKNFLRHENSINKIYTSLNQKSRTYLNIAQKIAFENDSYIRFESGKELKISTDIRLDIADQKRNINKQFLIKNPHKMQVLIADENKYAVELLSLYLKNLGIIAKPTSDWNSAKRHIEDLIFKPNIIFISDNLLQDIDLNEIAIHILQKSICIVIIQRKGLKQIQNNAIFTQYLTQPFLPEILVKILNNCNKYQNSGGGGVDRSIQTRRVKSN